jgi:hypothetical protein
LKSCEGAVVHPRIETLVDVESPRLRTIPNFLGEDWFWFSANVGEWHAIRDEIRAEIFPRHSFGYAEN